ncbi:MAG: ABC transporter ATP-binding protein [Lentisphaeria bacterium]|nr:ABC transporter ATP-binding protein [Lentisphaeria bacterium]
MITAKNVTKWFGPTLAVDDISFEVKRGEVLGFLGPNGAGKSTAMRIITGFIPLSSGEVDIDGHDIDSDPVGAKALIGYLPESAPAYPEMTVEAFLKFVAAVRGMHGAEQTAAVERAIQTCFLERVRHQTFDTLSKGYQHRTCFAQAILHDPPILVLDEPTDGLDPNQKHEMRELIREMGKEKAIIISTHILEEVEAICTRVIIIDRGKLVYNGSPDELKDRSKSAGSVTVRVLKQPAEEVTATLNAVKAAKTVTVVDASEESICCRLEGDMTSGAVAEAILGKGWKLDELHTEEGRLDEVFREITIPDTVQEDTK